MRRGLLASAWIGFACSIAASTATAGPPISLLGDDFAMMPPAVCQAASGPAPDPRCLMGKLEVKSTSTKVISEAGKELEPGHYTSTSGPCIIITAPNVTIHDSEIGPCGAADEPDSGPFGTGIQIVNGGVNNTLPSNIKIIRNVIHDVSTGILSYAGQHPIIIDRNTIFNVRKTHDSSHLIILNNISGGTGSTKITCNVSDGYMHYPALLGPPFVEDNISLYNTRGIDINSRVEVAYNKIRAALGGGSISGSGIMLGDSGKEAAFNGFYYVHDNYIVQANNTGIGVAGGNDITVESNVIDQRGPSAASMTGWPLAVRNSKKDSTCFNIYFKKNRLTHANLWSYPKEGTAPGLPVSGLLNDPDSLCTNVLFPTSGADANIVEDVDLNKVNAPGGSETTFQTVIDQCK